MILIGLRFISDKVSVCIMDCITTPPICDCREIYTLDALSPLDSFVPFDKIKVLMATAMPDSF